jgi:hypothetical protein
MHTDGEIMNTLMTKGTIRRQRSSISLKQMVLATLWFIVMSAARAQETPPVEPQGTQEHPDERETKTQEAEAPLNGLLQVNEEAPQQSTRAVIRDREVVFNSPGAATYVRDIRLSDNLGGLRLYGADSMTEFPAGAAIQVFGNSAAPFNGQLFLDSGANNTAALIFRTAPTNGTITERMRVGSNGNVSIGTTSTSTARLNVIAASGGAISAFAPNATSITGTSTTNRGVAGFSTSGIGTLGNSLSGIGVRGSTNSTAGLAGQFAGNVQIIGNLTKSSGSFKIDHPLDPENKYLSHSLVESPDMMTIYNGTVVLDAKGQSVVTMPAWFDALNKDFRYQVTAIGRPGPDLHIAEEIKGNQFKIGGGKPGMKVSWQVTGVRQDAYATANRLPVEEDKPAKERGMYLNPEAFGQPKNKGIGHIAQTELNEEITTAAIRSPEAK